MLFRQLSISRRLAVVLSLVLGVSLGSAVFALWQWQRLGRGIRS